MTCLSSFPNNKRNTFDREKSDPIDCYVLSKHTPSSSLVCRKKQCNNIIFLFIARFVAPSLIKMQIKSNTFRSALFLEDYFLSWFCLASGAGELSRIILKHCLLLVLRKLKQSLQSLNTLLFFSLSTLQFAVGFFEITFNC